MSAPRAPASPLRKCSVLGKWTVATLLSATGAAAVTGGTAAVPAGAAVPATTAATPVVAPAVAATTAVTPVVASAVAATTAVTPVVVPAVAATTAAAPVLVPAGSVTAAAIPPAVPAGAATTATTPAAAPAESVPVGVPNPQRAWQNWTLNCQGCHRPDGAGSEGTAPSLAGTVSKFLTVPGGREYLGRVPGVATSPFSNADLAELMNWMLWRFDKQHMPVDFMPFTGEELGRLRSQPLRLEASQMRAALLKRADESAGVLAE